MNRTIIALICLIVGTSAVAGRTETDDVRQFQAARFAAMIRHDVAAVDRCLADDLTYTHTTGETETKAQFLETLRSRNIEYEEIEPVDIVVRRHAETAIVTGRSTMHIRSGGQPRTFQIRFIEVDVRLGDRWQMTAWQATRLP